MTHRFLIAVLLLALTCSPAFGGGRSRAVRETAEYLLERFGVELAGETVESVTEKLGRYAARHGDEAIEAIRKVGPSSFKVIDDAGEYAPDAIRLLNRHGNDALRVASNRSNLALISRYGDEAADAMVKHQGIASPLIDEFGKPACEALSAVSGQNARRLAMMAEDGSLSAAGKADEFLSVVGRYGDKAAEFIWNNKGALAVTAVVAAFLSDPQPFIDGTVDLAEVAYSPVTEGGKEVGRGIGQNTNWTGVIMFSILALGATIALLVWRPWIRNRSTPRGVSQRK